MKCKAQGPISTLPYFMINLAQSKSWSKPKVSRIKVDEWLMISNVRVAGKHLKKIKIVKNGFISILDLSELRALFWKRFCD